MVEATKVLAGFLKPSGSLIVAEFAALPHLQADQLFKDAAKQDLDSASHTVVHRDGMTEDKLADIFLKGGLQKGSFVPAFAARVMNMDMSVIIGEGVKVGAGL